MLSKMKGAWRFVKTNPGKTIAIVLVGAFVGPVLFWAVNKAKAKVPGLQAAPDVKPLDPPAA